MSLFVVVRFYEIDYLVTVIQRRLVAKLKRFNHMQSALFLFAKMFRVCVVVIPDSDLFVRFYRNLSRESFRSHRIYSRIEIVSVSRIAV